MKGPGLPPAHSPAEPAGDLRLRRGDATAVAEVLAHRVDGHPAVDGREAAGEPLQAAEGKQRGEEEVESAPGCERGWLRRRADEGVD